MEKRKDDNLKEVSENGSLTSVRPPSEDIIKGAGADGTITELKKNRSDNDVDKEEQHGSQPGAYPGPRDGQ